MKIKKSMVKLPFILLILTLSILTQEFDYTYIDPTTSLETLQTGICSDYHPYCSECKVFSTYLLTTQDFSHINSYEF